MAKIKSYDSPAFTQRYMASPELGRLLKGNFSQFFIVRVEEMYRLVKEDVPATRSTGHSFIYITEGEAVMTIGSKQYKTRRGELLMVPAGQVFSFNQGDVNKGYLCYFSPDVFTGGYRKHELLKDFGVISSWGFPNHICPNGQSAEFILQLFERLLSEYSEHGLDRRDILLPYLLVLLSEINQLCQPAASSRRPALVAPALFPAFREMVYTHCKSKHGVKEYADLLHVTPNHLNKIVKSHTGKSPTVWIDGIILAEAKTLLRQTTLSVGKVALEMGFTDQSYFTRKFKKYEGVTPIDFRRGLKSTKN